ncbi:hypothetical protein MASR1M45_13000 [Candidatus Kapaibacterium sp.]
MRTISENDSCYCTINDSTELEKIRGFVIDYSKRFGFDDGLSYKIALAVDEVCSNLIKHAFRNDKTKEIHISVRIANFKTLEIIIQDDADPFDPLNTKSPDMIEYFKNFKKGGLGIHIMKLIMDEIQYIPKNNVNKWNTLILKKHLS